MRTLLSLGLALALGACATAAPPDGRPALRADDVVVYRSADDIPGEYEVIETIVPPDDIARVGSGYGATDAVERFARRKAASMGANGVLVVSTAEAASNVRATASVRNGYTLSPGALVAVYVTPPEAPR
ncbi:hypothetical protein RQM47_09625 [Rubrivirga sp. S365]|uniref:hypothetical protein n=1 Tax=Rubrivirga sp. S365 TaxID=3076080 RepID=UPI0028CAAE3C|nr:hypothetical protein [Rubrivirga sp. S365]MDT7856898.1 hypothetical protein [Rubrivirga sp. S365]